MSQIEMEISGRKIGYNYEPLIVAEIGINHNGSLDIAIDMADSAINAGAEMIKHQTHIVEDEMSSDAKNVIPANADISIYEIMENCALNEDDEFKLMQHVISKKRIFISTPFSRLAVDRLVKFDLPAFKIGSGECNNYPLIEYISSFKKPLIISTGMNTIESIKKTVSIVEKNNVPYALLHCTNVYPTPPELVRLNAIEVMRDQFPNAVIGLSDHTINNYTSLGAVALGCSIIEKHFTDTKDRVGPDIACSMDPSDMSDLIQGSKTIFLARGNYKGPIKEEEPTIDFAFASVVAIDKIKKGDKLSMDNIWLKRPGSGDFNSDDFPLLIGKTALRTIEPGNQLSKEDIKF